MPRKLPDELIEKIREEVKKGKTKTQVALDFGINRMTVVKYARDIPTVRVYSPEEKEKMRKMVREVGVKSIVARELGIPYGTLVAITRDIKFGIGNNFLESKTFDLLKQLMENGYALLEGKVSTNYLTLKKRFPVIQRVHAKGKTIAFLPDKKEEAVRFLLRNLKYKVMSFQELKSITRLFKVELDREEKQKFISKKKRKEDR